MIIDEKKNNHNANTKVFEDKIDNLVYKFYNLTEEEIALVESKMTEID